jgi:hypothetical protein
MEIKAMDKCPKCGCASIQGPRYIKEYGVFEKLQYQCRRCGYISTTPTLDQDRSTAAFWKAKVYVSTVFLGLDHSFGEGPPQLFETMIFGGEHDEYQERYSTWDEAEAGHKKACKLAGIAT